MCRPRSCWSAGKRQIAGTRAAAAPKLEGRCGECPEWGQNTAAAAAVVAAPPAAAIEAPPFPRSCPQIHAVEAIPRALLTRGGLCRNRCPAIFGSYAQAQAGFLSCKSHWPYRCDLSGAGLVRPGQLRSAPRPSRPSSNLVRRNDEPDRPAWLRRARRGSGKCSEREEGKG